MIYWEVVEDVGDGYAVSRKFRNSWEADDYIAANEGCMNGVDCVDTEADDFFYVEEDY